MSMKTVTLRNIEIGSGVPKVIVPIVGETCGDIVAMAKKLASMPLDAVEWRADFYADIHDERAVLDTLSGLRSVFGDIPLIFTCRTTKEGGRAEMTDEEYAALNRAAAVSGLADGIDIEVLSHGEDYLLKDMLKEGLTVIGSCHLKETPHKEKMVDILRRIQDSGADIPKLAVQARCVQDGLELLRAARQMHKLHAHGPIIAMAMGEEGVVSRIAGGMFGSAAVFAAVGKGSASGQLSLEVMNELIRTIYR